MANTQAVAARLACIQPNIDVQLAFCELNTPNLVDVLNRCSDQAVMLPLLADACRHPSQVKSHTVVPLSPCAAGQCPRFYWLTGCTTAGLITKGTTRRNHLYTMTRTGGIKCRNHSARPEFRGRVSDQRDIAATILTIEHRQCHTHPKSLHMSSLPVSDVGISTPLLRKGASHWRRTHKLHTKPRTSLGVSDNSQRVHNTPEHRIIRAWREA